MRRPPPVWDVHFDLLAEWAEVVLTWQRRLPDGRVVKFDEDSDGVLDLSCDEDERLLEEGFSTLVPSNLLLSCALYDERDFFVYRTYRPQHLFLDCDTAAARRVFSRRLFNPDSAADLLFIGGPRHQHEPAPIRHFAKLMQQRVLRRPRTEWDAPVGTVLREYEAVLYTQCTELHLLSRGGSATCSRLRNQLLQVASRHGLQLPP